MSMLGCSIHYSHLNYKNNRISTYQIKEKKAHNFFLIHCFLQSIFLIFYLYNWHYDSQTRLKIKIIKFFYIDIIILLIKQ